MAMIANAQLGDFIDRFRHLEVQRESSDELLRNLLFYTESTERRLKEENVLLRSELRDLQLDLTDANKARQELQQQVNRLERQFRNSYSSQHELDALQVERGPTPAISDNSITGMSPLPPPISRPSTTVTAKTTSVTNSPQTSTWAGLASFPTKASPPPQIQLPFPLKLKPATHVPHPTATKKTSPKQNKPKHTCNPLEDWNPGPRGLDAPLELDTKALETIKKRKDKDKLCNNHYLRGPCSKRDMCQFEHKYKPNEKEKVVIAYLARMNPCTNGQDCEVDDCIYGHHCPSIERGKCMHPYCKFKPWEHPPGTKFRPTYDMKDDP